MPITREPISETRCQPNAGGESEEQGKQSNMHKLMNTNHVIHSGLALVLALALWSPVQAQSAGPAEGKTMTENKMTENQPAMSERRQAMSERRQAMMERRQAMMAEIKAQDAELAAQVAQMNSAPPDKKLDLLAAIVTRLVEQRTAMNARMEKMQGEMRMPMMEHRPMGMEPTPSQPMMKGMDEKSGDTPKAQN